MKFSLIVATLGPTEVLSVLFKTLEEQLFTDFEVIVVDQNEHDEVETIMAQHSLNFKYIRSEKGLSRSRNKGIHSSIGDYLLFPDDDCRYPKSLLKDIDELLSVVEADVITFGSKNEDGEPIARFHNKSGYCNQYNIWNRVCSIGLVVDRNVIGNGFDESLGLGSGTPWPAGEDYDLPIRMILAGKRVFYSSQLNCFHDVPIKRSNEEMLSRAKLHSPALGRLWKIHNYPTWFVSYYIFRNLVALILSGIRFDKYSFLYYLNSLKGKIRGYTSK